MEADIPVLPEFMVLRIAEKVKANENWNQLLEETLPGGKAAQRPRRSKNWTTLAEKLRAMVRMKTSWGELHDIYSTHAESAYEAAPLPPWTRDPESTFSMFWDVALVLMLLFVTWTVPLRVCFEIDIELWSPAFFVDLVVDLFFVADVFINCRTTYFDANGFRETRPKEIFKNYLRSWFAVDVFSCLPFGCECTARSAPAIARSADADLRCLQTAQNTAISCASRAGCSCSHSSPACPLR